MRANDLKTTVKAAVFGLTFLLLLAGASYAQTVSLTAGTTSTKLPDGQTVPMWGYACGDGGTNGASCSKLSTASDWAPVLITVPSTPGSLTINLSNSLPAKVPTSIVIVGQLGGGLGKVAAPSGGEGRTSAPSPAHAAQPATWPIAGDTSGVVFTPPTQLDRVQSFATEIASGSSGTLTWTNLRPGTYLIESGTHPSIQGPMGLYGVLVVTTAPSGGNPGTAYPGVSYDADAVALLSEIDATQNRAVDAAVSNVGFSETAARVLRDSVSSVSVQVDEDGNIVPGAAGSQYQQDDAIVFSGGGCSVQPTAKVGQVDGSGSIVAITVTDGGKGCSSVPTASVTSVSGHGAQLVVALTLAGVMCSDGAAACYPPVVNYDPRYYLVNGVAFDRTNPATSKFPKTVVAVPGGQVLVRFVNAGLRMHVPSIVGAQTKGTLSSGTAGVVNGVALIAEDGNLVPDVALAVGHSKPLGARVQSEVFMAAGKTYDVLINAPGNAAPALPVFDRALSLSTDNVRDGGMQAYLCVNGCVMPQGIDAAVNPDQYYLRKGQSLSVSDPGKGVIANDVNVYGVTLQTAPTHAAASGFTLNANGTFSYKPLDASVTDDAFSYCANNSTATTACTTVTLAPAPIEDAAGIHLQDESYTSRTATKLSISRPGILAHAKDAAGYPVSVDTSTVSAPGGLTLTVNEDGSFTALSPSGSAPTSYTFTYKAKNSQGTQSATSASVTVIFPKGSGLAVKVVDAKDKTTEIKDYRWIIEEDRTFHIDPTQQVNNGSPVPTLGTNFHTSYMPVVAQGCVGPISCESGQTFLDPTTGSHTSAACDVGSGVCTTDRQQQVEVDPKDIVLDSSKHYYISILPGDGADPFNTGNSSPGHTMGGAPIGPAQGAVTVSLEPTPLQTAKVSVFVFEDDDPLNGENDAGGGVDVLAPNEPGLGGFEVTLFDDAGGPGDATGQITYDMFNMPLSNALAGTPDPTNHGMDACPISKQASGDPNQKGIVGVVVTCPKYEADGTTLSPLAGQVVIANLYPGRYGVVAAPAADRIGRGEEWLQTNTLDGQKAHDSFIKVGGPGYFQEYGPAGYHVSIGFANPAIINARKDTEICANNAPCSNTLTGNVTTMRISRTPDERLYSSGSRDSFGFTQCYVSLGDTDGEDFAFTKCDADGNFTLSGLPNGNFRMTLFDQWNDQIVDGLSVPVTLAGGTTTDLKDVPAQQWHTNVYTRTYFDTNGDGVSQEKEAGLALVPINIRFRDGSYSNFNSTDLNGYAGFNEIFPLFNWYTLEADTTRYKQTGVHVVYDAGGPADGTQGGGTSNIAKNLANTKESVHLPPNLRFPGSVYCADADCNADNLINNPTGGGAGGSTGRIDPPWVSTEGWQGFIGQNEFVEFGKKPFADHENGGIKGHVIYASTRPFDDPQLLLQTSWMPMVPNVTVNLYQEGTAPDGTPSLKLVDTTVTTSWDGWAQGFRSDGIPNMNCPGQQDGTGDLFFFSMQDTEQWLNPGISLPNHSQFKCFDGLHNYNQVQPAPYDGMYNFPSVTSRDPVTGKPTGTNCDPAVCQPNTAAEVGDWYRGTPMLPAGKYVVEVVVPPGYELVKEEDKNILIGDNYIAPVTQQFGGLGYIFILPDQAEVSNANNPQDSTQDLGASPRHEGDTGSVETFWPCVGQLRVVPDYISLFPQSLEVAPFAGASRHLCDRKEVTLEEQSTALAKFYIFSSTHVAAHFTGIITDDYTSEFDPFSPAFGEKFSPPNLPVSIKDFNGNEISRVYSDQWGQFNGLNYSTWEVNPPNPTGYAPTMMVACMNDPGPISDGHGGTITDPAYNPAFSQFCYEIPFMPGQTQYMDTPVVPTSAFAGGYNHPDCAYPNATPAIKEVDGDGNGPWVSAAGHTLTITALGDQTVPNHAYSGPSATTDPYNKKTITRHYGFGGQGTVTIGGKLAAIQSWDDGTIKVTVPTGVPNCTIQQRNQGTAQCGELVITSANGKQSIDTVTVTIGGSAPKRVTPPATIQSAIDAADPGDLIMVDPGTYNEMVIMWKPVRLQGVGAASVTINANTHPSGKIDPWRRQVACLFGLALNGQPISGTNPYDGNPDQSARYVCDDSMNAQVDRIPQEGILGWDTTLNGNLAQLLQEPTLMGAYEGAGITVLGMGERVPDGVDQFSGAEGAYPAGTVPLTNTDADCNQFKSNFWCNPARIDGISVTNSSQGGGGILLHGWNHYTEISNNRVYNNSGTLSGGITVNQGEFPDPVMDAAGTTQLPYAFNNYVNVHNNMVTANASYGDELYSATPEAAGGVTFCTGSDYYKFAYNWVCGNMSTGDGGGFAHLGFIYNGDIEHNWFLFNQSINPTIPTDGGAISVLGAAPDGFVNGVECGSTNDEDCPPGLSEGTGPGLVINANLILGNGAESGSGGGLRLQNVNGAEVALNATNPGAWYHVAVTNNIIANNVAGWDGGGVSLQDALSVDFINNTVVSNDSTASSGVLFNTLGAGLANNPPPNQVTASDFLPAGLVTVSNSANLNASFPAGGITCPAGHSNCAHISNPVLANNLFWQNRSFHIQVGGLGDGALSQQNLVTLIPTLNQIKTGDCITTGANSTGNTTYWDIGVRGDKITNGTIGHDSGYTLNPTYSVLTSTTGYSGTNTAPSNVLLTQQYCNGSRVPPENGGMGYNVPPGISDATVPNPLFSLQPSATVDEGNNWINMTWGPLSLAKPDGTTTLANYAPLSNSPAVDYVAVNAPTYGLAPARDFFGNNRPAAPHTRIDAGAVEVQGLLYPNAVVNPTSLAFANQLINTTSAAKTTTLSNTGNGPLVISSVTITGTNAGDFLITNNPCGASLAPGANCIISVAFKPTTAGAKSAAVTIASNDQANPTLSVGLTGTGVTPQHAVLNPTTLAFGSQALNNTSAAKQITLSNTGSVALAITSIAVTGTNSNQFAQTNNCGGSLAGGATCTINVTFRPTSLSPVNKVASVTVTDNSDGVNNSTQTASLTGTAVSMSVNPTSLTFAGQIVGTTSASQTLTVANGSGGTRSLNLTFTGAFSRPNGNAGGTCGNNLTNNNSCTINVVFRPTAAGAATGQLAIATNGGFTVANSPVHFSGTGIAAVVSATLTPAPYNFGTAARGVGVLQAPTQVFTLTNTGNVNLTNIARGAISGTNAADFPVVRLLSTCGPTGGGQVLGLTTLAPGGTCVIVVQFRPRANDTAGGKSATLSVGDAAGTQTSVLSGTAQ